MEKTVLRHLFSVVVLLVGAPTIAITCSCGPYEFAFCKNVNENHNIALGVVLTQPSGDFMGFAIHQIIHGSFLDSSFSVLGQDGLNCGESLGYFQVQDTVILALSRWDPYPYYLHGCGRHFLFVRNGLVSGQLNDGGTIQITLEEFMANLEACLVLTSVDDTPASNNIATLYPNPASSELQITLEGEAILGVEVYDQSGQHVPMKIPHAPGNTCVIDITGYARGVYVVMIHTSKGILTRKLLKI